MKVIDKILHKIGLVRLSKLQKELDTIEGGIRKRITEHQELLDELKRLGVLKEENFWIEAWIESNICFLQYFHKTYGEKKNDNGFS